MMTPYHPVLNVYVVWHPDADALCQPLAESIYTHLNCDPNQAFARGIGIPTYFRSVATEQNQAVPLAIDLNSAVHSVVFVLVEDQLVTDPPREEYCAELYAEIQSSHGRHLFVPVALTESAFNLDASIATANFVRLQDLAPKSRQPMLVHYVLHCLAQLLENKVQPDVSNAQLSPLPIKLFISHTKRNPQALRLAEALKIRLDSTQLDRFFDTVDIASGHRFDQEIIGQIGQSALIAIRSDQYSDSPWCRMEVMTAKRLNRPIIVVDALQHSETRSFPYLSNVPAIRFDLNANLTTPESKEAVQAIIDFALREVLRFIYIKKHFEQLKACHWLPEQAIVLSRPPEERDFKNHTKLKNNTTKELVYPDPPLGFEENSELNAYQVPFYTPMTQHGNALNNVRIGISISDSDADQLQQLGLSPLHLQAVMLDIARYCLAHGASLVYGGDLRPNGFTEDLLELARYHNDALEKSFTPISNYLAWPLWPTLDITWQAKHKDALQINKIDAPEDLHHAELLPQLTSTDSISQISSTIWARCLTAMRERLVEQTDARIMIGGRTVGYKGKYPGLVEEALLTLKANKPLYLLGGFGGAAHVIIKALHGQQPIQLTKAYQQSASGDNNTINAYNQHIADQQLPLESINYDSVQQVFTDYGIAALNNGLTEQENTVLFATTNHEQAIGLILKGLTETC